MSITTQIIATQKPQMGLLPDEEHLSMLLSSIGLTEKHHVVAYDDEGGGRAARFLWTLAAVGHDAYSLLNGGLHAWVNDRLPLTKMVFPPTPSNYKATISGQHAIADYDYIQAHLDDPSVLLLDCRTTAEYSGKKKSAGHAGHIPGAVNFDWLNAIDQGNALRLKSTETLQAALSDLGVTPDKEVIVYCHSHHRSAHTYIMLKNLGFENVRGYPGSWSEWGNLADAPVE